MHEELLLIYQPEFLFSSTTDNGRSANGRFKPAFDCKAPPIAPGEADFASGGHATSGKRHFPDRILGHFSLPPHSDANANLALLNATLRP